MKKAIATGTMIVATLLVATGCQVRPAVHGEGRVVIDDGSTRVAVVFSDSDRRHIHDYYEARYRERHSHRKGYKGKGLPPGLAKRDRLPPGLAKRDRLPPGLSGSRLPVELDRHLSRLPEGVARVRIGAEIVLMDEHSRVVLDVIKDIPLD